MERFVRRCTITTDFFKYSDEMYGKESYASDVWEYVTECKKIGEDAFKEKYGEVKMYI